MDWTVIERRTKDRKGWKKLVMERMERVHTWEKQKRHKYEWREEKRALEGAKVL